VKDGGWDSIKFRMPYELCSLEAGQEYFAIYFKEISIHFLATLQRVFFWKIGILI
jgi:hypothetical protein